MAQVKRKGFSGGIVAVCLAAMLLSLVWAPAALCKHLSNKEAKDTPRFVAYYFYTSKRCGPCTRIEHWAEEAVNTRFKDELASGKLRWRAVNVQQAENKHYIQDFQLYSKSVIIAEYQDGKSVRYENLKDVWKLYRDKPKYLDYVAGGIKTFMEKK